MAYLFTDDNDNQRIGGNTTKQESAIAENRDPALEWDPEVESWEDFEYRLSQR